MAAGNIVRGPAGGSDLPLRLVSAAVMLALEGVHFEGVNFGPTGGDVRNMLFRPMSGQRAIGSIPVRNCTFRNCQFHTLGITGGDDLLETLVRQVVTPG